MICPSSFVFTNVLEAELKPFFIYIIFVFSLSEEVLVPRKTDFFFFETFLLAISPISIKLSSFNLKTLNLNYFALDNHKHTIKNSYVPPYSPTYSPTSPSGSSLDTNELDFDDMLVAKYSDPPDSKLVTYGAGVINDGEDVHGTPIEPTMNNRMNMMRRMKMSTVSTPQEVGVVIEESLKKGVDYHSK